MQMETVGSFKITPNLINAIPREAIVKVDLRNTDDRLLQDAERRLGTFLRDLADRDALEIQAPRLARLCPTAMIFVPGIGGISLNPFECTRPELPELGANVLLQTVLRPAD